ncbi:Aminodeoxychorismate lyase [Nitrincola lacisaponensis]|uniref:Aminodeoxychorismate lyase n=1 Tax=Nitrincola lacisaponensis TaxID=267850 RepID=A0A063Y6I9_9GAMM|nr:aminodeoxychorismate lyase [Nitrincola lacisaponensis]KDE40032.1 Aminodeoxychorismate lyase [Nitrincola lacisaponensis]
MVMTIQQWVNGKAVSELSLQDRGLSYGHGVFETLRIAGGKLLLWPEHLERLLAGCQRLSIPTQWLAEQLQQEMAALPSVEDGVLKIIVTAGEGGRGYRLPVQPSPTRILQLMPVPVYPDLPAEHGIEARWCQIRLACAPALAGIKHLNRLEQVLARAEWADEHIREGILCGQDGYLAEGTMSNLFLVYDGVLITPDLHDYGVAGIMRQHLMALAGSAGISVEVKKLQPKDLLGADEVFFCNSLIGIWPLRLLEQQVFIPGPVTRRLQALLTESYCAC